jgi:hypothetical protein
MSGTFWIIGDGEIHVERRALNGAPEVQTIYAGDVETIDVEPGNSEDNLYVIAIRLRTGNKIRSSELAGRAPAEALQAEIMRRLNVSKVAR